MTTPTTTTEPEPNWSNLPKHILSRVARQLDLRTDLPKLRAVCPSWRTSLPKDPPTLSTTVFKIPEKSLMNFLLLPSHFYLVTPHHSESSKSKSPWLIRVNLNQTTTKTFPLQNPFNQTKYSSTSTSLSLLNTTFLELSTTYTLFDVENDPPRRCSKKVVGGWALDSPFRFSILGHMGHYAFTWNLGDKYLTWVRDAVSNKPPLKIVESAFYNKKFYSFDTSKWKIGVLDPSEPSKPTYNTVLMKFHPAPDILLFYDESSGQYMVNFITTLCYLRDIYLVPTGVGLYLVLEMCDVGECDKVRMIVYKMRESVVEVEVENKKKKKKKKKEMTVIPTWEIVESLDDQVFFLGFDTTFSIPNASVNLPQWKPNSICLFYPPGPKEPMKYPKVPETLERWNYAEYGKYVGVFVLGEEENGVVPFEQLPKEVFTGLFFPMPPWAKSSR